MSLESYVCFIVELIACMLNTKITFSYFSFTRSLKYAIVLIKQIDYFVYFFLITQAYSNVIYEVFYINITTQHT